MLSALLLALLLGLGLGLALLLALLLALALALPLALALARHILTTVTHFEPCASGPGASADYTWPGCFRRQLHTWSPVPVALAPPPAIPGPPVFDDSYTL